MRDEDFGSSRIDSLRASSALGVSCDRTYPPSRQRCIQLRATAVVLGLSADALCGNSLSWLGIDPLVHGSGQRQFSPGCFLSSVWASFVYGICDRNSSFSHGTDSQSKDPGLLWINVAESQIPDLLFPSAGGIPQRSAESALAIRGTLSFNLAVSLGTLVN